MDLLQIMGSLVVSLFFSLFFVPINYFIILILDISLSSIIFYIVSNKKQFYSENIDKAKIGKSYKKDIFLFKLGGYILSTYILSFLYYVIYFKTLDKIRNILLIVVPLTVVILYFFILYKKSEKLLEDKKFCFLYAFCLTPFIILMANRDVFYMLDIMMSV